MLRVGVLGGFDTLNPLIATTFAANWTVRLVYPALCQYATSGKLVPDFATEWKSSAGGKTWTFTVRSGAKWSDGQPISADDAAFTLNMLNKYQSIGAAGAYASAVVGLEKAVARTPDTLEVSFSEPLSSGVALGSQMCFFPILPKHVWSKHLGSGGNELLRFSNVPAVTGGPFAFGEFRKNEIGIFKRYDDYYGTKPISGGYGIQVFSSEDGLISALKANEIDVINGLSGQAAAALSNEPSIGIERRPGLIQDMLFLNVSPKRSNKRWLNDARVRHAMALSVDRKEIVSLVHAGFATPTGGIVGPASGVFHNASLDGVQDLDEAGRILDEAGYARGGDGIRRSNADGDERMSLVVITDSGDPTSNRTFQILKAGLTKIGIEAIQRGMDGDTAFSIATSSVKWDALLGTSSYTIDPDQVLQAQTCGGLGTTNFVRFCDKAYDSLYSAQRRTSDTAERADIVKRATELLFEESPVILFDFRDVIIPYSKTWTDVSTMQDGMLSYLGTQPTVDVRPAD